MFKPNDLKPDERIAFDMYFASLCSMQVHPGAGTKGHEALTFEQCRDKAIEMMNLRRGVMKFENED